MAIVVVVMGRNTNADTRQAMANWKSTHPREKVVDEQPPAKTVGGKWCGAIVVDSNVQWLPSDINW